MTNYLKFICAFLAACVLCRYCFGTDEIYPHKSGEAVYIKDVGCTVNDVPNYEYLLAWCQEERRKHSR